MFSHKQYSRTNFVWAYYIINILIFASVNNTSTGDSENPLKSRRNSNLNKMKKILFALSLIFVLACSSAKSENDTIIGNHEIELAYLNLSRIFNTGFLYDMNVPYWGYYGYWNYSGQPYYNWGYINSYYSATYGFGYKYHIKRYALRAGVDFNNTSNNNNATTVNYSNTTINVNINSFTGESIRIGAQYEKKYNKMAFYAGLDLATQMASTNYTVSNTNNSNSNETGTVKISKYSVIPFMGIEFKINKMFSITTETSFRISSYKVNANYSGHNLNNSGDYSGTYTGTGNESRIYPIGLFSFNIHL